MIATVHIGPIGCGNLILDTQSSRIRKTVNVELQRLDLSQPGRHMLVLTIIRL